ncbi:MAG: GNAT family N-acetyltransferase [Pseudomonadota bacterium]
MVQIRRLTGETLGAALEDVARLRIEVFAEWPYLYDGDLDYEARYLQSFRSSPGATLVVAQDGDWLVGAATGAPLTEHADDFRAAFDGSGIPLDEVFYCAESVLLPHYRGRGIGHRFFDLREETAAAQGFSRVAFCAVQRPEDHPQKPATYRSLEPFWRGRGYEKLDGVVAEFSWKDLGHSEETYKPLQFWMKSL